MFFPSIPVLIFQCHWYEYASVNKVCSKNHTHTFSTQDNYLLITKRKVHVYLYAQTHTSSFTRSLWYNRNGWLGVKHQVTYLLAHSQARTRKHIQTSMQTHGQNPCTVSHLFSDLLDRSNAGSVQVVIIHPSLYKEVVLYVTLHLFPWSHKVVVASGLFVGAPFSCCVCHKGSAISQNMLQEIPWS